MKRTIYILLFILATINTLAQSIGPSSPHAASYSAAGCLSCPGSDWFNPINISGADSLYATTNLTSFPSCFQSICYYSRLLYAYDFGFSIPPNATIVGIKAEVLRKADGIGLVVDSLVQLKTYLPVGQPKADINAWPTTASYVSYGDSTDLWGYSLTADSINSADFGLALCAINKIPIPVSTTAAKVDQIQLTVWYTVASSLYTVTRPANNLAVAYDNLSASLKIFSNSMNKINEFDLYDSNGKIINTYYNLYTDSQNTIEIPFNGSAGCYFWQTEKGNRGKIIISGY